jgi:hypothetical protein
LQLGGKIQRSEIEAEDIQITAGDEDEGGEEVGSSSRIGRDGNREGSGMMMRG